MALMADKQLDRAIDLFPNAIADDFMLVGSPDDVRRKYKELNLHDAPRLLTVSRLMPPDYTHENARQILSTFAQG